MKETEQTLHYDYYSCKKVSRKTFLPGKMQQLECLENLQTSQIEAGGQTFLPGKMQQSNTEKSRQTRIGTQNMHTSFKILDTKVFFNKNLNSAIVGLRDCAGQDQINRICYHPKRECMQHLADDFTKLLYTLKVYQISMKDHAKEKNI
jgi:hypothetical protein